MLDLLGNAKAYDAALARRDYAAVAALLAPGVVYISPSVVGRHEGRAAVLAMLQDFFTRHPDANWTSQDWRLEKGAVSRRYRLFVPSAETPEQREREGGERFFFTPDGLIAAIVVTG